MFSSSKLKVRQLSQAMRRLKWKTAEMHSDLDQAAREQVMHDFRAGRIDILIATDILARGIDIDDIAMVVNYDVPHEAEDYVHRIGRTARADADGKAVTFVSERDQRRWADIEKFLEIEVPRTPVPEEFGNAPEYRPSRSGSDDRRKVRPGRHKGRGDKPRDKRAANKTETKTEKPAAETAPDAKPRKKRRYYRPKKKQ